MSKSLFTFIIIGLVLFFSACTKDTESDPSPSKSGKVSVKLNGNALTTDSTQAQVSLTSPDEDTEILTLVASKVGTTNYSNLLIFINEPKVGTFDFDDNIKVEYFSFSLSSLLFYNSDNGNASGSITITELDYATGKLKGTFNLTINDRNGNEAEFTEGTFDVPLLDVRQNVMNYNFSTDPSEVVKSPLTGYSYQNKIYMAAGNTDIEMAFASNIATGTYTGSGITLIAYSEYQASSVNLTITSHDLTKNRVKGTFTAELVDFFGNTLTIESANFDLTYAE